MIPALNTVAAVALAAGAVGVASGAYFNGVRWESKYQKREIELLQAQQKADEVVKNAEEQIRAAADRIARAPVKRVLCATSPPEVPAGGSDATVGGGGPVPADRDYGPAMRECLVLQQKVKVAYELGNDAKAD